MTVVSLLRHGEIKGGQRFRGSTNDPLTQTGLEQMRQATSPPFSCDLVISSPLIRCADFARPFASRKSLPLHIAPLFAEMHFGDWEGLTTRQVYDMAPKALEQFWSDPDKYPPPAGERLGHFQNRVLDAWDDLTKTHQDKHILLVTHGGVIRILLCHLQGIPVTKIMELEVGYGALFNFANDNTARNGFELKGQS